MIKKRRTLTTKRLAGKKRIRRQRPGQRKLGGVRQRANAEPIQADIITSDSDVLDTDTADVSPEITRASVNQGPPTGSAEATIDLIKDQTPGGLPIDPEPDPSDNLPGPIDVPDFNHAVSYLSLDAELPLALLPVRLEARFYLDNDPPELRIRVFPDQIHADMHMAELTDQEINFGRKYWRSYWQKAGDVDSANETFSWLAKHLGAWRAAWVIGETKPQNLDEMPAEPLNSDTYVIDKIRWPRLVPRNTGRPVYAKLLPERWAVIGYRGDEEVGIWWGEGIPADLTMGPGLVDIDEQSVGTDWDAEDWLRAQEVDWMFDFDQAESVGMGIRIDLTELPEVRDDGFNELHVVGIRSSVQDMQKHLRDLFQAHRYTSGMDIIPQGTPTNNTDTAGSGVTAESPDLIFLREAEMMDLKEIQRPQLQSTPQLYEWKASDTLSVAFGLETNALDRCENAGVEELARSKAMNQALWPSGFGYYFKSMLKNIVTGTDLSWLNDWYVDYVRGNALIPSFRIGTQPYGVLPVALLEPKNDPQTRRDTLASVIHSLWYTWLRSVQNVSHLDPDATDVAEEGSFGGETDTVTVLAQILSSVPHPTQFRLRTVENERNFYELKYGIYKFLLYMYMAGAPAEDGDYYDDLSQNPVLSEWEKTETALEQAISLAEQINAYEELSDYLYMRARQVGLTQQQNDHASEAYDFLNDIVLVFLAAHDIRIDPIMDFDPGDIVNGIMPQDDDPSLFYSTYAEEGEEVAWQAPLVSEARDQQAIDEVRAWIEAVFQVVSQQADSSTLPSASDSLPLLQQLLIRSANTVEEDGRELLEQGIETLKQILDDESVDDPIEELERLTRESLGLTIYRLDAWITSLAAKRLAEKRKERKHGLQVGGYGWLVELKPRQSKRPSQGYILAPSINQATTAAILRSAWAAYGGNKDNSALATDLSSERTRRATWLLEGVRLGQDLAELLGGRFERNLHDNALDQWIHDIREAVLNATSESVPANKIVDGLLLARAYSGANDLNDLEQETKNQVDDVLNTSGGDRFVLNDALKHLVTDLDSAADILVAQSVHALAHGNTAVASSSLSATGSGDAAIPEIDFANIPREAQSISHRVIMWLPETDQVMLWPAAQNGRALATPQLEKEAERLLGDAHKIVFKVTVSGVTTNGNQDSIDVSRILNLQDVGLSALDLLILCPENDAWENSKLYRYCVEYSRLLIPAANQAAAIITVDFESGEHDIQTSAPNENVSLGELLIAARALRSALMGARVLNARDFLVSDNEAMEAQSETNGFKLQALQDRYDQVLANLAQLKQALQSASEQTDPVMISGAMLALIGYPFSSQIPVVKVTDSAIDVEALAEQARKLVQKIENRLSEIELIEQADESQWSDLGEDTQAQRIMARLSLLIGKNVPLCPLFDCIYPADLTNSLTQSDKRLGQVLNPSVWINQLGKVRAAMGRMSNSIDLLEAVRDDVLFNYNLVQLPHYENESWAATAKTLVDEKSRLCLLSTTPVGTSVVDPARPSCGLILDAWTEVIPKQSQTSAITTHFDAPGARPPQVVLLATVDGESGWSFAAVKNMLTQTMNITRARAVGPDNLDEYGQFMPVTYLEESTNPGEALVS